MIQIKKAQYNDFRDVNVRRTLNILNEKKHSIEQSISIIEQADKSFSLNQIVNSTPDLQSYLQYILGDDWMNQANNDILGP